MGVKRHLHRLQGLANLGFPAGATSLGGLVFPIDEREQALVHPPLPPGREDEWLQILTDALPPEVYQGGEGRDLLADLGHGVVTGRQLMALG
jgi:hypothetical protein